MLYPAGLEAERIWTLFWVMVAGGVAIWALVIALAVYVVRSQPRPWHEKIGTHLVVWGGCVFPAVVVTALLVWGLGLMAELRREADGPTISITGERFWWRISYGVDGGPGVMRDLPEGGVESANELWLPLGRRSEILLGSTDVIHSFWAPSIAGKMDAIPGRVTRLILEPTKPGVYRAICAEFCGESHAFMGLRVVVVPQEDFDSYVAFQRQPAETREGRAVEAFMRNGCSACHTVRGTRADGEAGPDLTHLASRRTLAAGMLPLTDENIAEFVRSPDHFKPGVEMPSFGMLPDAEIALIAEWLGGLE